jgi:hypothetical protein
MNTEDPLCTPCLHLYVSCYFTMLVLLVGTYTLSFILANPVFYNMHSALLLCAPCLCVHLRSDMYYTYNTKHA